MSTLTVARLKELFHYHPRKGQFVRAKRVGNSSRQQVGFAPTGTGAQGYPMVTIDGRKYSCHRLAWLYVHGTWPVGEIDHINGDRTDYRIANIRDVSHAENIQNVRKARTDSKSGLLGASWCEQTKSWVMAITTNGVRRRVTGFLTAEAAHQAYRTEKKKLHPTSTL